MTIPQKVGLTTALIILATLAWMFLTGPVLGILCEAVYPIATGHSSDMHCFHFTDCVSSLGRYCP